jgi:hypothetical protein
MLPPREGRLDILKTDASEFRNVTAYSICHEFPGRSVMKFDEWTTAHSVCALRNPSIPRLLRPATGMRGACMPGLCADYVTQLGDERFLPDMRLFKTHNELNL